MYHRKQFVVTKDGFIPDGFLSICLSDGYTLAYHKDLPLRVTENKLIIVLGDVWQTDCGRDKPLVEMEKLSQRNFSEKEVTELDKTWCGEYIIIANGKIFTDAVGMRCVYYAKNAVAGCAQLLLGHDEKNLGDYLDNDLVLQGEGETFDYFPGPLTNIKGIRRLLPSQILNYDEGKVTSRDLIIDDFSDLDMEHLTQKFIDVFTYSMQEMRQTVSGTLWLALTGGHDSRTSLALLVHAGLDFNCFTLERALWTIYGVEDYYLPPILASKVGKRHILLSKKKEAYDEKKRDTFYEASMRNVSGNAVDDYAYGQYEEIKAYSQGNVIWIGSAIWEVYENFYRNFLFQTGKESVKDFLEFNKQRITSGGMRDSLIEYYKWTEKYPQKGLDNIDRFYWEQGCAIWNAPYDQAKEFVDGITTLQPLNCRTLLSILFSLPKEMREGRKFEEYLTIKLCPQFAGIGYSGMPNKEMLYFPYYLFAIGERVVIYGAGQLGQQYLRRIQQDGLLTVVAIIDREAKRIKVCRGMVVSGIDVLKNLNYDVVMITLRNSTEARKVKRQLVDFGVPVSKIKAILPLVG